MKKDAANSGIILIFVDGLGIGAADPEINPVHCGGCPHLEQLLAQASPIDARLGIAGTPQSATGQTTLLTGLNAARIMGRHVEGFPGKRLREIIREHNVLKKLIQHGRKATFANAYYLDNLSDLQDKTRIQSVTTVTALSALGRVHLKDQLHADHAVYHDLTRRLLVARGYKGPVITPARAAMHLVDIAVQHDLTLFEYFMTDRVGHQGDVALAQRVLSDLDGFLAALSAAAEKRLITMVLTSDHGNIEDISIRSHTMNDVPLIAMGPKAERLRNQIRSLTDVTPALLAEAASANER